MVGSVADRTREALLRLGERGKEVLKVALDVAESRADPQLGDFDYRTIAERCREMGLGDPKMILRVLERDFGVLETSYHSYNQHWWKFVDAEQIREALGEEEVDPEVQLIRIQFDSLDVSGLEKRLRFMLTKPTLTESDKRAFREMAFDVLPSLTELYRRASAREETANLTLDIGRVMALASQVSRRIAGRRKESTELKEPTRDEPQRLTQG